MESCDHALLAVLALGEPTPGEARAAGRHLGHCLACREELKALEALVETARAGPLEHGPVRPPARVWEAVAAEMAEESRGDTT